MYIQTTANTERARCDTTSVAKRNPELFAKRSNPRPSTAFWSEDNKKQRPRKNPVLLFVLGVFVALKV